MMSLDVYLIGNEEEVQCTCDICGHRHTRIEEEEFYWANITGNLTKMAQAAGISMHLWRPDELGITLASELIEPLEIGLATMKKDPARFKAFNSPNGWGLYQNFVPWVQGYLGACKKYPDAKVRVSR